MSESERVDADRRAFMKKFAVGAAVVPLLVTTGCFVPVGGGAGGPGYGGY
jgi:hypothetical protein